MKKLFAICGAAAVLLAACGDSVPKVADPHNIVIDGKPMTQQAFLATYCMSTKDNPTCIAVANALVQDASKGKTAPPRF